ncbi:MAG: hypothetical protein GY862_16445, partial [Gammaproteobacteria bacterium]|nr:hypothetical protein [Gammaproteobacteria bacterium]
MNVAVKLPPQMAYSPGRDRPAWIPPEIGADWDTNPYAYQTEAELMPAGGPHGLFSAYIMAVVQPPLEDRGLMLLQDTFMLYRDAWGIERRTAPDLLLMPKRVSAPSVYDLDIEPPPSFVAEITSPRSQLADLEQKRIFYFGLGISTYLVIDTIIPQNQLYEQIGLYLWRGSGGKHWNMPADKEGWLALPEIGAAIRAPGKLLQFKDSVTDRLLYNTDKLTLLLDTETKRAETEKQRADSERYRADAERYRADAEKDRADAEKRQTEAERQRADSERERADAEKRQTEAERQRA